MRSEGTSLNEAVQNDIDPSKAKALECARAAIEKKAENVKVLDLTELSSFTDYFVVCSGMSDRQLQTISESVEEAMANAGKELLAIEGFGEGRWILMDFGDVIVHVFLDALREYYDLEKLWADAPRVKVPSEFYGASASRLN
jgi:ribosome-associated protein